MQIGESFGEACRYCGSTMIVLEPLHLAGNCARCASVAGRFRPWADRLVAAAQRHTRGTSFVQEHRVGAIVTPPAAQNPSGSRPLFGRLPPRPRMAPAMSVQAICKIRPAGQQLALPGF